MATPSPSPRSLLLLLLLIFSLLLGNATAATPPVFDGHPLVDDGVSITMVRHFTAHRSSVYSMAWDPSGERLLTGSYDYTAAVHSNVVVSEEELVNRDPLAAMPLRDDATAQSLPTLETRISQHSHAVTAVAWSANGRWLATASLDYSAKLWSAKDYSRKHTLLAHKHGLYGLSFAPDSKRLVTGGFDDLVYVWDVASGDDVAELSGYRRGDVNRLRWSPDGQYILSTRDGGAAELFYGTEPYGVARKFTIDKPLGAVWAAEWSPDSKYVALSALDDSVRVFDVESVHMTAKMVGHRDVIQDVSWNRADTDLLLSCGTDGTARVWRLSTSQPLGIIGSYDKPQTKPLTKLHSCIWHPSGRFFVSEHEGGILAFYAVQRTHQIPGTTPSFKVSQHLSQQCKWSEEELREFEDMLQKEQIQTATDLEQHRRLGRLLQVGLRPVHLDCLRQFFRQISVFTDLPPRDSSEPTREVKRPGWDVEERARARAELEQQERELAEKRKELGLEPGEQVVGSFRFVTKTAEEMEAERERRKWEEDIPDEPIPPEEDVEEEVEEDDDDQPEGGDGEGSGEMGTKVERRQQSPDANAATSPHTRQEEL